MASELRCVQPGASGDHVFHVVGDVALHAEAEVLRAESGVAPSGAQFVAASSRFGLVFFGDVLGACPTAARASLPCARVARLARRSRREAVAHAARLPYALSLAAGVCGLALDDLLSHAAALSLAGDTCVALCCLARPVAACRAVPCASRLTVGFALRFAFCLRASQACAAAALGRPAPVAAGASRPRAAREPR